MANFFGPVLDVDPKNIECFWDGNSKYIDGQTWKSAGHHEDVANHPNKANVEMVGSPTYTQLGTTGYWSFNGTSQYGYIRNLNYGQNGAHGPNKDGELQEITCGCWFRTSFGTPNAGAGYDFSNWSWYDWDRSEVIGWNIGAHGKLQFAGRSNITCCYDITSDTPCNDGQWHFGAVVVSASGGYMKFYLDGEPDGTRNNNFSYFGHGTRRYGFVGDGSEAGSENAGRNGIYYEGDISQLFLLSTSWTDAQVKAHYDKTAFRYGL